MQGLARTSGRASSLKFTQGLWPHLPLIMLKGTGIAANEGLSLLPAEKQRSSQQRGDSLCIYIYITFMFTSVSYVYNWSSCIILWLLRKGTCQGTQRHPQTDSSATLLSLSGARVSCNDTLVTSTCIVQLQRLRGQWTFWIIFTRSSLFYPEAGSTLLTSWQRQTVGTSAWLASKESWATPAARCYHGIKN